MADIFKNNVLLKVLISAAIIALLAARMDMGELKAMAGHIHISAWAVAAFFIILQILALSHRWLLLINVNGQKIGYSDSVRITLASLLANYLFITSVGGIVVRVLLAMQEGVSFVKSVTATALDRFMTLVGLLILTVLFLPILHGAVPHDIYINTIAAIALIAAAAVALPFFVFKNVRRNLIFVHRKVAVCFKYLRSVVTNPDLIAKVTLSSLIGQVAYFAAVYAITASSGAEFSLLYFMAVLPMITVVASLPVGYGGWGIREGAFVYGLGLINVPLETAFIVSVQIGLISMAAALLAGIPALLHGKTKLAFQSWKPARTA